MLKKATQLMGCTVHATDGDIGSVSTVLFDDEHWTVRYFVVDTGKWLPGRKVLISPLAVGQAGWEDRKLDVTLTREQVKNSPDIDTDRPVSRQHEMDYYRYYGYPSYWGGVGFAPGAYSGIFARADEARAMAEVRAIEEADASPGDSHLRDTKVVRGYHIRAADGDIGHVEDFLIDDQHWSIRYMLVDTRNWLGGRHVLIAPTWVKDVSWGESTVRVALNRQAIEESPEYHAASEVTRDYEQTLHSYYGRPGYWIGASTDREARREGAAGDDARLARLDDLSDVEVADGEPDVKGWKVFASDGLAIGSVEHLIVESDAMKVRYLEVGLEDGVTPRRGADGANDVLIPIEHVDLDEPNEAVRLRGLPSSRVAGLPSFQGLPLEHDYEQRLNREFEPRVDGSAARRDVRLGRSVRTESEVLPPGVPYGGLTGGSTQAREGIVNRSPDPQIDVSREDDPQRDPRLRDEDPSHNR